jgi:hypothetical protein
MPGFAEQVESWSTKTEHRLELAVRKIALDAFSRVIMRSPVDTGRFRANWMCAIGHIPDGTVEIDDKAGTATISKMQAQTLKLKAGQTIYLINNLPYGPRLERGWSKQAPAGMIEITRAEFEPIVKAVARELNR